MADPVRPIDKQSRGENESSPAFQGRPLSFDPFFCAAGRDPFEDVSWEKRSAILRSEKGHVVFQQHEVEVPVSWSDMALNVVVSRYFRGVPGTPERESSVRDLVGRVAYTIGNWGAEQGYFATERDARVFTNELLSLLIRQIASFNSPVWFNVGVDPEPQCSACFIISVDDSMDSILQWYHQEGIIFKGGSGSGVNISGLRSEREALSGGGTASGPVSFMKAADASAGVIKSGGKTRRAAKMVILDVDHPDILAFVHAKADEEKKARALIRAGYDGSLDGEAYATVAFQNSNHSVRVSDEFMRAVEKDAQWTTRFVLNAEPADAHRARDILREMARAAHFCGDPGIQFHTTINGWHTCPETGPIRASNPCSEFMHVDDSACNLASLRLSAFLDENRFNVDAFRHAVDIMITAQEIIVDKASYPTPTVTENSRRMRALGLGFADMGALLMGLGLPYDSHAGRAWAAAVSALMTGEAYVQSARLAEVRGPFAEYDKNSEAMLDVVRMHRDQVRRIDASHLPAELLSQAEHVWNDALEAGSEHGYRNCQTTVLAPTGTVGFMMDCDTTGIEPEIALVKYKSLSGGGRLKIVNKTVEKGLRRLGYPPEVCREVLTKIEESGTIEGFAEILPEHLSVFDCAFKPLGGERFITPEGHIRMMAAVQPFISGAISKTVNLPHETTVEQIEDIFLFAWRLGLKAITVYRDGCKAAQPLDQRETPLESHVPVRRRLPVDSTSVRHKFEVAGQKGYIHTGFYPDGKVGEIFIRMAKEGSTISGLMDTIATLTSIALQYGVPLEALVNKFSHVRFEPSGFTTNPDVPIAKSLTDYIFRYLGTRFLDEKQQEIAGLLPKEETASPVPRELPHSPGNHIGTESDESQQQAFNLQSDAPACPDCGSIMIRNGSCYKCLNCGGTSGCS